MANQRERKGKKEVEAPIEGAGGIVVREGAKPLVAVVQRRKDNGWVLPKGKLKNGESAIAAAEREVIEETGQQVRVGEFLGVVSYKATSGKPKVVQFWRMQAIEAPKKELTRDIKAVKWLPLESAIAKLDDPVEQLFLRNVGQRAVGANIESIESLLATVDLADLTSEPPVLPLDQKPPREKPAPNIDLPKPTLSINPYRRLAEHKSEVQGPTEPPTRPQAAAVPKMPVRPTQAAQIASPRSQPNLLERIWQWLNRPPLASARRHRPGMR